MHMGRGPVEVPDGDEEDYFENKQVFGNDVTDAEVDEMFDELVLKALSLAYLVELIDSLTFSTS